MRKSTNGFTVVELLIVIAVVAILAAITIISYNLVQLRSLDARRLSDITNIEKALEIYKAKHGAFPAMSTDASCYISGNMSLYESNTLCPATFLKDLHPYIEKKVMDGKDNHNHDYYYKLYPAGTNGCSAKSGPFYVIAVVSADTKLARFPQSPGWKCSTTYNWHTSNPTFRYVSGGFLNE